MATTISDIYKKAIDNGVLSNKVSEERFAQMLQNEQERKAYWEFANKQKPNFYSSDYDVFSKNASALFATTNQPSNAPAPSQVQPTFQPAQGQPTFWQSIGAHDPYPQKTAKGVAQAEREQQLQREDTATMPLSQQDKDRQAEIQRLQAGNGALGRLPVKASPVNQDEIDRLKAEQPSYITREIKTPQDLYTSVSEAWTANTPDGQKAKAELDKTAQDTYNNLLADMNRQIADLQQQVNNGTVTQQQAQQEAQRIADNTNAVYENEMQLAQDYFFRQMTDANADYLSQQARLLGQKATNQTISDINARIAPHIRQLETERQQAMQRASQSVQAQGGMYGAIGASMSANTAYKPEKDQELALYHQSQQFLADAAKISDAAQKGEGFWKGLGKSLGDIDTWDFGISQLTRSANLKDIVEKYERGEQLTDAEKGLMDSAVAYMSACAYNSDKINRRYKMGQTTGESIPFMLQFMVMPIGAIKDKVAKGVLGYGIEQFGGKAAQAAGKAVAKYGAKTAFKEAGTALLGNLAAAGVQTAAFGVPKIAEGAISRMTGDIQPTLDEQGNITYGGRQNQQSTAGAIWNSTVDMYAENLSEMILTSLDPLKAFAGTTKLFQGLKSSQIAQVLGKLNEGVIGKVRDRAQFRNYLEEVSEEYVGNLIRWGLSTDVNNAEDAGFSADQQIDTWLGLAPTSIAFVGAGAINNAVSGGIDRFQSSRAAKRLREIMADGDKRRYLESLLKSRNSDDFSKNAHEVIKSVLRDKELNEDTKRLIMDGIYYTYQSQLAQEAEQARVQAEAERQAQPEQPETANVSDSAQPQTQAQVQVNTEGEEHYQDADGNEVTFYRNADGSVTLRDKNGNAAVDEQGNAVTLTQTEFDQYARDTNLRRVDRELTPEQWAERENQLRQQYEAEVQPNTHNDGNVYEVVLASDVDKRGYIVGDGKVEIDDTTDPAVPRITNSDVVTVRYEDGTMAQVAAKDLNLVSVDSANDIVEDELQPFKEYAQAMQTFRIGQEVSMDDEYGNTYTSRVVSVSEDGVEVEIEDPFGNPQTWTFDNSIALTTLHPVKQEQTQQSITPVGEGDFGYIYDQFAGKPKEAIAFLSEQKSGEALGALHHNEVGDIDLVWGYEGTGKSDGFGLAKLLKYHPEVVDNLQEILNDMHVVKRSENRIQLESDKYAASVRLTWNDEKKTWLLTAFQKKSSAINNTTDTAETHKGMRNDTATPQSTANLFSGKGTANNSNTQVPILNINMVSGEEFGENVVEYMGGDKASAVAYLEAERDKADAEVKRLAKQKVTRYTDIADFKRQNDELQAAKKAAADRYNKLQNAITAANHYQTQAEQAEQAARKAREEEKRAARRQTQTAQLANAAPAERWKAAPAGDGQEQIATDIPASNILEQIEAEAEPFEEIELTPANWYALFGEDGIVSTPIGYVKMGEHQYLKLAQKGRDGKLGMIKPTLEHPSVVVMDKSQAKDGQNTEREFSYVFVKAFVGKNGERLYYFTSITVSKDGQEVVISNQEKERSRIQRLLKNGKLAYINKATLPPASDKTIQGDQLTNPVGEELSSADKGTKNIPNPQTSEQKSAENPLNASQIAEEVNQISNTRMSVDDSRVSNEQLAELQALYTAWKSGTEENQSENYTRLKDKVTELSNQQYYTMRDMDELTARIDEELGGRADRKSGYAAVQHLLTSNPELGREFLHQNNINKVEELKEWCAKRQSKLRVGKGKEAREAAAQANVDAILGMAHRTAEQERHEQQAAQSAEQNQQTSSGQSRSDNHRTNSEGTPKDEQSKNTGKQQSQSPQTFAQEQPDVDLRTLRNAIQIQETENLPKETDPKSPIEVAADDDFGTIVRIGFKDNDLYVQTESKDADGKQWRHTFIIPKARQHAIADIADKLYADPVADFTDEEREALKDALYQADTIEHLNAMRQGNIAYQKANAQITDETTDAEMHAISELTEAPERQFAQWVDTLNAGNIRRVAKALNENTSLEAMRALGIAKRAFDRKAREELGDIAKNYIGSTYKLSDVKQVAIAYAADNIYHSDNVPNKEAIEAYVEKIYNETKAAQVAELEAELGKPLSLDDKKALIRNISDGKTKVVLVTNKNIVKKLVELGATRKTIADVTAALSRSEKVNGFCAKGTVILNTDALQTGNDIIATYVHERQHLLTAANQQTLSTITDNATADELAQILQTITGTAFYDQYNNGTANGHTALADELVSHIMQEAYATGKDAVEIAQNYGINNETILQTLNNIDYEQRQSNSLSKARRDNILGRNSQSSSRQSSRDNQTQSRDGLVQQGTRPAGKGSPRTPSRGQTTERGEIADTPVSALSFDEQANSLKELISFQSKEEEEYFNSILPNLKADKLSTADIPLEVILQEYSIIERLYERVNDYVAEHYPTQDSVSALNDTPQGKKEREAMKKDPALAQLRKEVKEQQDEAARKIEDKYQAVKAIVDNPSITLGEVAQLWNDALEFCRSLDTENGIRFSVGNAGNNLHKSLKGSTFAGEKSRIPKAELAAAYADMFRKQAQGQFADGNGIAYSANYLHEFSNGRITNSIRINGNEEKIQQLTKEYGTDSTSKTSDTRIKNIWGTQRPSSRNDALSGRQRSGNERVDRLYGAEQSDGSRDNQKIHRDKQSDDSTGVTDPRFSVSGTQVVPLGERTLVGLHNITSDKLRKVLKAGGLANPSAAVIDIAKQDHHGYGEISLVMPSSLVDSREGNNAGTYTGDAYTPMYPPTQLHSGKDTVKHLQNLVKDLPQSMSQAIYEDVISYIDGNSKLSGLQYLFLKERGQELPIDHTPRHYPYISIEDVYDRLGIKETPGVFDNSLYEAYEKLPQDQVLDFNIWLTYYGNPEKISASKEKLKNVQNDNKLSADMKRRFLERMSVHLPFSSFDNITYSIYRDGINAGKENTGLTIENADRLIDKLGLRREFAEWENKTIDNLGYEEVLFAGYDRNGYKKYIPNTPANASRLMNKQSDTNTNQNSNLGETKSMLLDKLRTLAQIRKHRDILDGDSEKVRAAYDAANNDWLQLGADFLEYTKTDKTAYQLEDNPFIAIENALARIQEAMMERNPIAYLNTEYHYSLPADSEWANRIADIKKRIKDLPAKYFETKFKRPVSLNEFRNAVVPNDLSQDLRDGLEQAGLGLYEYDPETKGSRREATLQATEDDGIRFSVGATLATDKTLTEEARKEMQSIAEQAKADGMYMQAPNGKPSNLTERQWLQVRTRAFKNWFGNWEKSARIEKLRNSEPAIITGSEFEITDNPKKAAIEYGKKLQGYYTNKDTGIVIQLQRGRRNGGINEVLQHNYKDIPHIQSVAAIPQIIEKSIFIDSEPNNDVEKNPSVVSYDHYVCGLKIGDADYTVHALIAMDSKGNRYYDHNLVQIEKKKLLDEIQQATSNGDFGTTPDTKSTISNSDRKITKLFSILQTNSSKCVDVNGEPLVVYHGTPHPGFSIFNTLGRFRGKNSTGRNTGVYTTPDRNLAYIYTSKEDYNNKNDYTFSDWDGVGQVYPLYLNIKNPLVIECDGADFDEIHVGGRKTSTDAVIRKLRRGGFGVGYDGVIFKDVYDGDYTTDYVALSPNQIKSATSNNGSFSENSDDIRFSIIGERNTPEAQYDELDYDTDNLTDAQQLATDAVLGALDEAGISVERVSEEEAEREVEKDESDSNVRLMLQMEQGTQGLSYHPIAGAKVAKNLETAKNNYTNLSNSTKNAISDIAKALGARNTGTSNYITIEAKNGTIFTLRLSNHNATVANFDNNGETQGISIVISRHDNKGVTNNGNAHIVEYFYPQMALVKADGTPIADIIGALEQTMYSGEYTDPTGLAQRQEVNIPAELQSAEFSIRQTPAPKNTGIGYKVFYRGKDGKLYPPMVANPNGADTPIGVWLNADAAPISGESKTGRPQVKAGGKGTQGGSGQLAYRPGWHLGEIPYALQFNRKDENGDRTLFPKDFVWAEVEYAADVNYQQEAEKEGVTENGKYRHSYAGLKHLPTDGYYRYRTNPNPETDPWIITGAMKVNRVLTNEEVDALVLQAGREPQQREFLRTSNGTIYGYAKDGKIYLTDNGFNPNTPIHEYTHLWVKAVRNNNPELYNNLRDLFSRENLPDMWDELDHAPQYRDLSDEAKLSEIIARFSGKRGAKRMEQEAHQLIDDAKRQGKRAMANAVSLRERMRNLLRRFWNWVGEHLFRIKHFGSREEAADRVLYDLFNGTDLGQTYTEQDSKAEFSASPMPKRIEGEMVHEWARRIAEWKRQQVDEQQVAEYAKLLKRNGSKKSRLFAQIVDKFTPIDNFQQWVQAQGGEYNEDTMDMHGDLSMALGRTDTFSRRYKEDYMQRIADSITRIVKDDKIADPLLALGLKWQNFDNKKMNGKPLTVREIMGVYAQAKDTWEADQQGLSDRGAQGFVKNLGVSHTDIIEAVERIIPQKQLDEFWNAVYAANQFALDYQLNAGMIDPDTRNRYTRRYYVPQRGWRERDFDGKDTAYISNGTRLYGNPYNAALVKAHGRESLASDPFALIESIGLTSIIQSEHNKSKQQLLNLLLANEMLGLKSGAWRVKQVWSKNVIDPRTGHIMRKPDGTPVQAEVTYAAPTQQEREHDADINARIDQLRKELRDLTQPAARAKRENEIADLQDQLIYTGRATDTMLEHRTRDERMQHQVIVLKDGQQYIIELQDARLANAVNGNFDEAWKAYALFNKYNTPAIRYVSGMLTQYNPRFAHRNFWRDVQAAFLNNLSEQGMAFTTRAMANILAVQRTVWQYIWSDTYKNKESYGGQFGDYLREYFEAGAQTGFSFMPELERMAKDFDKMVNGENAWDKAWGRGVKGTLSLMTEASELTVRFAEYVTARQMGRSVQEAAKMAKNISVNFNQSGLLSKEMSKFFTFFNATIQGNMRFLMPYGKNKPKFGERAFKFGAKFAGMAANFALLGLFSTFLQPDAPDDDTWFTEYDRMSNFILFGKVKIPVVHFFRMFYAAGVQVALAAQGRKTWKDAFYTSADYALGELVPASALQVHNLLDYDKTTNTFELNPAKYAQAAAPSVISPLVDVAVNRDFKGSTVYRKKWDNDKKDITTAKRNTPQWAVDVSNTLHRWSGGNPDVPYKGGNTDGWIDIKPNAIEHIAQGYFSGVWESLGHTVGFIWDGAHDTDVYKHATNWPFLRDLFRDYSEEKAYNQQYYSVLQKLEKYEKRVNSLSQDKFDAEEQTSRFSTFEQVADKLRSLPNPYNDEEATVTSEDVNKILQLDIELNRNLFAD